MADFPIFMLIGKIRVGAAIVVWLYGCFGGGVEFQFAPGRIFARNAQMGVRFAFALEQLLAGRRIVARHALQRPMRAIAPAVLAAVINSGQALRMAAAIRAGAVLANAYVAATAVEALVVAFAVTQAFFA